MTLTTYPDLVQGSDDWLAARRGLITASIVGKLITSETVNATEVECHMCGVLAGNPCVSVAKGRTGPLKNVHPARAALAREQQPVLAVGDVEDLALLLAAERITGTSEDNYVSNDMWRGIMAEPVARDLYSRHYTEAREYGFMVRHGDGWSLGWSPDGLVGDRGCIEIKAPRAKAHLKTILSDEVPAQHMPQCQAALFVSGLDWLDFISFHGGLPLYVKRVLPDPAWFAVIEQAATNTEAAIRTIVADCTDAATGLHPTERLDLDWEMA